MVSLSLISSASPESALMSALTFEETGVSASRMRGIEAVVAFRMIGEAGEIRTFEIVFETFAGC